MTHIAHKMPKTARRLGFAVGHKGRFLTATKYPSLSQKNHHLDCKIFFDILSDMDYKDG